MPDGRNPRPWFADVPDLPAPLTLGDILDQVATPADDSATVDPDVIPDAGPAVAAPVTPPIATEPRSTQRPTTRAETTQPDRTTSAPEDPAGAWSEVLPVSRILGDAVGVAVTPESLSGVVDPLGGVVADHPGLWDLLEAVGVGVMRWDLESEAVAWSDAAYRVHGRARWRRVRQDADGLDSVHPDDRARVISEWRRLRRESMQPELAEADEAVNGRWSTLVYQSLHDDGTVGHVRCEALVSQVAGRAVMLAVCSDITSTYLIELELKDRLEYVHAVLASTPDAVLVYDVIEQRVVESGTGVERSSWPHGVHPQDVARHAEWLAQMAELRDDEVEVATVRLHTEEAGWQWYDERCVVFHRLEDDTVEQVLVVLRAVHEETELAHRLAASEQRFRTMFDRSPVPQAILDTDGRFHALNDEFCALVGRSREELLSSTFDAVVNPHDRALARTSREDLPDADESVELRLVHGDGHEVWARVRSAFVEIDGVPRLLVGCADVTVSRATEQALRHDAMHDDLTGLPNRRLLIDRLGTALARARRVGTAVGVFFIDLDGFKTINDSLGHAAGDEFLIEMGRALRGVLREPDTLARLAGDEFVAVCEEIEDDRDAVEVGRRLVDAARSPIVLQGERVSVSASIGYVLSRSGHDDPVDLLTRADAAMFTAKGGGGARVAPVESSAEATRRTELERELREALAGDALALHYQPVVGLDGHVRGVEALLRWPHPDRGLLAAGDLSDLLDVADLAGALAEWACERAVAELAAAGLHTLPVRVNVPARSLLRPKVGEAIRSTLERHGRDGRTLVLEVREADVTPLLRRGATVRAIDTSGASFGLDRFGAESAPLGLLRRLPLRTLALDHSLIERAVTDPADTSLLHAVVSAARSLGIVTIALGVETDEALEVVRRARIDTVQGYRVAAPEPLTAHLELIGDGVLDLR